MRSVIIISSVEYQALGSVSSLWEEYKVRNIEKSVENPKSLEKINYFFPSKKSKYLKNDLQLWSVEGTPLLLTKGKKIFAFLLVWIFPHCFLFHTLYLPPYVLVSPDTGHHEKCTAEIVPDVHIDYSL